MYLVVLVAAVVGTFFLTNYTNNQKLTSDSEAAARGKCTYASTKKYPGGCNALAAAYKTSFSADPSRDQKDRDGNVTSRCCVAEKQPTPKKGVSCTSKGGNWYRTTSYSSCGKLGAGYKQATGITETRAGFLCCITEKRPTSAAVSCTSTGGKWYKVDRNGATFKCSDIGAGYSESTKATEKVADYVCCVTTKLPTISIVQKTCKQQGGNWYRSSSAYGNGFDSCQDLADVTYTPYADPDQAPSDQATYKNFLCCVPQRVPTSMPTPTN